MLIHKSAGLDGKRIFSSSLVAILFCCSLSFAQSTDVSIDSTRQNPQGWFLFGVELGKGQLGPGAGISFKMNPQWAIGLRGGFSFETILFVHPVEEVWWVSPMVYFTPAYGTLGMVSIGVGPGLIGGVRRGQLKRESILIDEYEEISYHAFSVTSEIQAAFFITRGFGLIGAASLNLNNEQNHAGVTLGIQFRSP